MRDGQTDRRVLLCCPLDFAPEEYFGNSRGSRCLQGRVPSCPGRSLCSPASSAGTAGRGFAQEEPSQDRAVQ